MCSIRREEGREGGTSREIIMVLLLQTRSVLQLLRHNTAIVLRMSYGG